MTQVTCTCGTVEYFDDSTLNGHFNRVYAEAYRCAGCFFKVLEGKQEKRRVILEKQRKLNKLNMIDSFLEKTEKLLK